MTLGNVNDAPVRLNALVLENTRSSIGVLMDRITFHYSQEFFSQLYRVLGSADILGNPIGLFSNVSSGVADIFYEPISGFIVHGNRELGIGIARVGGPIYCLLRLDLNLNDLRRALEVLSGKQFLEYQIVFRKLLAVLGKVGINNLDLLL